jgi:Protein of unknown function (DUF3147)
MLNIKIDISSVRQGKWYEYFLRFLLGGAITAITGAVAKQFGPSVGGLFLAFPAILPSTVTLVEKHETEKKLRMGFPGAERGKRAAALDAAGAARGSIGLLAFAEIVRRWISHGWPPAVLAAATVAWALVGVSIWMARRYQPWRRGP